MITVLISLPLAAALLIALSPSGWEKQRGRLALGGGLLPLAWTGVLWWFFDPAEGGRQLVESRVWIPALGGEYLLGLDGIGMLFVLLTGLVVPFSLAASIRAGLADKAYLALILVLQGLLYGCFTAGNFLLWFLFWELTLIPTFLLLQLWGGPERRTAAMRLLVMTLGGGLAMLAGFLALHAATGTFDFGELARMAAAGETGSALAQRFAAAGFAPSTITALVFGGVLLGLAVKVPMWPLHLWLPDAYEQAPTPVSMLMTGVLSKMGIYGFLRILLPVFPDQIARFITPLLWLSVATIVFSAFAALAQKDLKRMVAYSSINHLGYCLLGLFAFAGTAMVAENPTAHAASLAGVLLQTLNHGITASALFCFVLFLEIRGNGRRSIDDFGGLRAAAPVFCGLMGISLFSSLGLPGLNGFVGEFLIFKGAFALAPAPAAVSTLGLLGAALLAMRILLRVFHGHLPDQWRAFADLTLRERLTVMPAIGLMILLGVFPHTILTVFNATVARATGSFGL